MMNNKKILRVLYCVTGMTMAGALALTGGCPTGPTAPAIGVSPVSVEFAANAGGANPQSQILTVTNAGVGELSWSVTDDAGWLTVTPATGMTTTGADNLTLAVDITGLTAAGSPYTAQITITAAGETNSPRTVPVTLTVTDASQAPAIDLSVSSLAFTGFQLGANPASQTIQLSNSGTGTLAWTASDDADWLSVSPTGGNVTDGTAELVVAVDTVGLTALASPYSAQITITGAGTANSPQTVDVVLTLLSIADCEVLDSQIDTNTTLSAGCYVAETTVSVSGGAMLTIAPGATIFFEPETHMTIWGDGRMSAVGTETDPIVFRGVEPIRGYWGGIRFYHSNSTENRLEYVTIEDGGGYWDANLYLTGGSAEPVRLIASNCTFRNSESYGFYWDENVAIVAFNDNTSTFNAMGAGYVSAATAGFLDDTSSYTGNDTDIVRVWGATISADQTWPGINADYLIDGTVGVSAMLTIDPGARITFESGDHMTVWDDGQMRAVGTADNPIVFTGMEAIRGYWGGLRFYHSNSTTNRLEHVTVAYGGGYWDANLYLTGGSGAPVRISVVNCELSSSASYGFYWDEDVVIDEFGGNTVTENTLGAGHVSAATAGYLDDTSTYTGNDVDQVRLWGATVAMDQTWPGIDADYFIDGTIGVSALLMIERGAQVVFDAGGHMTVWEDGQMQAIGNEQNPIVFTGLEQTPGYWGGLRFYHSNSEDNQLDWVTIEYGGGYWEGNLYLVGASSSPVLLSATNCLFQESSSCGVSMNEQVTVNPDFADANDFFNNAGGDICN